MGCSARSVPFSPCIMSANISESVARTPPLSDASVAGVGLGGNSAGFCAWRKRDVFGDPSTPRLKAPTPGEIPYLQSPPCSRTGLYWADGLVPAHVVLERRVTCFFGLRRAERGQALGQAGWEPWYNRSLPWERIQLQLPFPRGDERSQSHRRLPHQYWGQLAGGRKRRKTGYDRASPGLLHHVRITPICVGSAWGFYPIRRPPPGQGRDHPTYFTVTTVRPGLRLILAGGY